MKYARKSVSTVATTLLTVSSLAGGVEAALIFSPTAVVSNSMGNFDGPFPIGRTIDQSGLLSTFSSGITDYDSYIATVPTTIFTSATWYSANGKPTGYVVFDLGSRLNVTRIAFWSSDTNDASINSATWSVSDDASFATGVSTLGTISYPAFASGAQPVIDSDVTDGVGRYLRLSVISNHGMVFSGFGEVAVAGIAIPEPSSAFLLGLGAIGLVIHRRRS